MARLMIDIDKNALKTALETYLASQKRARNTATQPEFIPVYERLIAHIQSAVASIQEVPDAKK